MQKTKMVYFLSSALGGPIVWVGQSMKQAHSGKVIQEGDFMAFIGHLYETLEEMKVDKEVQMKVLDLVNGLKPDIVDPPLPRTLYEKLNVKQEYQNAMNLLLDQTMNHFSLQSHFSKLSPQ